MSANNGRYQFRLQLYREDSARGNVSLVGTAVVRPSWQPAMACAKWRAVRRNPGEPALFDLADGTVMPVWHESPGPPYVRGVLVGVPCGDGAVETVEVPTAYFRPLAVKASRQLVEAGRLDEGEAFRFAVCAYASDALTQPDESPPGLVVDRLEEPLPLDAASLDAFLARSVPYGELHDEDAPVFVPESVLRETITLARGGCGETGGILVGHLHRDPSRPEVFVEVSAQISATHAQPELSRLTFTPETWAAVDAEVRRRNRNEIYVGWWHSHPARQWCDECPAEKRAKCHLTGEFFSTHDESLHRCCFPRAYSLALVISDSYSTGLTAPMFGWRNGLIEPRGFFILDGK